MILRIERIDVKTNIGLTVIINKLPEIGDVLWFDEKYFSVNNVIRFTSHTTVLVKEVNIFKIFPSMITGINDMISESKARKVLADCRGCGSQDLEGCESFQSGLISACIAALDPTDEELSTLIGAGQEVIDKIKLKIYEGINKK